MSTFDIKTILTKGGYVSDEVIAEAEKYIAENGGSIESYLFSRDIISSNILGQAVAEYYGLRYANIDAHPVTKELLELIPEEVARKYRFVIKNKSDKSVTLVTDSTKPEVPEEIRSSIATSRFIVEYALPESIDQALLGYRDELSGRINALLEQKKGNVSSVISDIIADALLLSVSDVHFEPRKEETLVRFRIDGVLHEVGRISNEYYETLLNRVKVLANLRIDEHGLPQDGAIRYEVDGKEADLRISIVPLMDGEKIVIRILSHYVRNLGLGDLGLSAQDQALVEKAAREPFGMIITVGPTGSGKTTTLYALVQSLNSKRINVTTIEDPVEYRIPGVNQIQVNTQTGLTFGKGLRSIVRQDPNVILVGEIRDLETAEISVNAGMTGHLVLSTFHANTATSAIPRMLNMGIESFLLGSTLKLIVAQRLVRKVCQSCRHSKEYTVSDMALSYPGIEKYFDIKKVTLYEGAGCTTCSGTGYKGRVGVYEVLPVSNNLQEAINQGATELELRKIAHKEGIRTLFENGIEKVKSGETTLAELTRVIPHVE